MNRLRGRPAAHKRDDNSSIVDSTLARLAGASSAVGEQPKIATFISDIESHAIVKFTPTYDDLPSRRWRDILVSKFHALTILNEFKFSTADTRLLDQNGRYFIESKRFDRELSLSMDDDMFSLLPAYDMCSMGFAPKSSEVTEMKFSPPAANEYTDLPTVKKVFTAAAEFWNRVAGDDRASDELRQFIVNNRISETLDNE